MRARHHSRTAWGVALHRAVHQNLEGGSVFADPFAQAILGPDAEPDIAGYSTPDHQSVRLFVAARSRFAQDCLTAAVARGVAQVVVLGAGLDTTALRNPGLTVFEVDHPATQDWKRHALLDAKMTLPPSLHFVPVDFETQGLPEELAKAGFDANQSTFFIWLGVVPYLTQEAIGATLDFVLHVPHSEIVFDYSEPPENYPLESREKVMAFAARVAALGEPWLSHFHPPDLADLLRSKGFADIEDLGPQGIAARYFNRDSDKTVGPHILRAAFRPRA